MKFYIILMHTGYVPILNFRNFELKWPGLFCPKFRLHQGLNCPGNNRPVVQKNLNTFCTSFCTNGVAVSLDFAISFPSFTALQFHYSIFDRKSICENSVCVLHSCTQIALQFRGRHIQMIVGYLFQCVVLKLSGWLLWYSLISFFYQRESKCKLFAHFR